MCVNHIGASYAQALGNHRGSGCHHPGEYQREPKVAERVLRPFRNVGSEIVRSSLNISHAPKSRYPQVENIKKNGHNSDSMALPNRSKQTSALIVSVMAAGVFPKLAEQNKPEQEARLVSGRSQNTLLSFPEAPDRPAPNRGRRPAPAQESTRKDKLPTHRASRTAGWQRSCQKCAAGPKCRTLAPQ